MNGMNKKGQGMRINCRMSGLAAGTMLALAAAGACAKPLSATCGPNNNYVIGVAQANFKEPYREHVDHELQRLVKNYPKFKLVIADGQADVNTQVSDVENFRTQQVDLLFISPFESAPLTPVVSNLYKSGTPVIELDRKTTNDQYTAFIGGDNRAIAEQAGRYAASLLPDGGEVAVLEGLPSSSPAIERLEGFKAGIAAYPKIKLVAVQPVDWMEDKAETVFASMLQAHPGIKLVYTSNDLAAAGAYIAVKDANKLGQVKIIGTDGLPGPSGGVRSVADGQWAATFVYPTGAAEALDLAKRILIDCASSVPRNVTVSTQVVDQSNAKSLYGKEQF